MTADDPEPRDENEAPDTVPPTPRVIREATFTDRPTLQALQSLLPEPAPSSLDGALSGVGVVLVSTTTRPVGYVIGIPGDSVGWIAELVVAPDARREGHGRALVAACCDWLATDHERARLAVTPDNEAARSLYRSLGFERVGRSKSYFETGPALFYERTLGEPTA